MPEDLDTRSADAAFADADATDALADEDAEFALLLTHDVDRPYKTGQSLYYALADRDPRHLRSLLPDHNPWWQFEEIMKLEADLGVRSSFYFLRERHALERAPGDWVDPFYWVETLGRYDVGNAEMVDLLQRLDRGGWEVGLHGSFDSYDDPARLRMEKSALETALGRGVTGGRHHHLRHTPETWKHHREMGLRYDASPGSSSEFGFARYQPFRPFGDEFVVFPLTLMEIALPDPGESFEAAWRECESLLEEAAENDAVMSILWHPRMFYEVDFPGYRELYRRIIERALEMGAWVGPPADFYDLLDHPEGNDRGRTSPTAKRERGLAGDSVGDREAVADGGETEEAGEENSEESSSPAAPDETADKAGLRGRQAEDNKVQTDDTRESTG
ncbi:MULTISPECIES: polysaccharide deacetylase family protein [Halorussus]|uniref:polysaccharide deacetylase family protein n=1 Tax=Halorussus TaxID=1070314 RepID=UPI00209ECC63|nr:polysaccharide deacetylase family protein [Halorussus vallis]USZ76550.1 polysaccharide deacetylase family protein [Halorussus vallis]